jgi:sugar phosphate isomerase/epimerase
MLERTLSIIKPDAVKKNVIGQILARFEAAARAGFEGVEFLFPYDHPKEELAERLRRFDLEMALHNLPAGDWAAGERGIGCLPGRTGEFQESVGRAIEYATALGDGIPELVVELKNIPYEHGFDPAEVLVSFIPSSDEVVLGGGGAVD